MDPFIDTADAVGPTPDEFSTEYNTWAEGEMGGNPNEINGNVEELRLPQWRNGEDVAYE